MTSTTRTFPATSRGARAARVFATAAVPGADLADADGSGGLADDVALVVSELAANAVLHAGTAFSVTVVQTAGTVRIEVSDANPVVPQLKDHGNLAPTGRGLRIVEQLTTAWGVESCADGKTVWVEIEPIRQAVG